MPPCGRGTSDAIHPEGFPAELGRNRLKKRSGVEKRKLSGVGTCHVPGKSGKDARTCCLHEGGKNREEKGTGCVRLRSAQRPRRTASVKGRALEDNGRRSEFDGGLKRRKWMRGENLGGGGQTKAYKAYVLRGKLCKEARKNRLLRRCHVP